MKPILYQLLFRLIDYRLIMVCQFCEVTFVYGESLQWGFGFASYCFIGCVIESREEHLCFWRGPLGLVMTHQMFFLRWFICVPMVWGWVWLRIHQSFWFLKWTLSFGLFEFVGWDPSDFWFLKWISWLFMVDFVREPSEFGFWGGSHWCCRQNLRLLISFQHEGVCEAWTPGSWLPWWTI